MLIVQNCAFLCGVVLWGKDFFVGSLVFGNDRAILKNMILEQMRVDFVKSNWKAIAQNCPTLERFKPAWEGIFASGQWFLALFISFAAWCRGMMVDGQSRCRSNMQQFNILNNPVPHCIQHCSSIDRIDRKFKTSLPEGLGRSFLKVHNGFWHCAHNGEMGVLGLEGRCFWLMQVFSDCAAIVHHCARWCNPS